MYAGSAYPYSQPSSPLPMSAYPQVQPYSPPVGGVTPGSITYTTSQAADGRLVYHPFKAVPASYQTPTGLVHGIQWVPAEATFVMPQGAQPANEDFVQSWGTKLDHKQAKALKDWEKTQLKLQKKEEKAARKLNEDTRYIQAEAEMQRNREMYNQSAMRGGGHDAYDSGLRNARERDAQDAYARERRKSVNMGVLPPNTNPMPSSAGYPPTAYTTESSQIYGGGGAYDRSPNLSNPSALAELDRRFNEMNVNRGPYDDKESRTGVGARSRRGSMGPANRQSIYASNHATPAPVAPRPYSVVGGANIAAPYPRSVSPYHDPASTRAYTDPSYAYGGQPDINRAHSPLVRGRTPLPPGAPNVYPPGHVMEGQPIGGRSRATTPNPVGPVPYPSYGQVGGASPRAPESTLNQAGVPMTEPEGFSRPLNAALSYTPFEPMKIQDMDDFAEHLPRMPLVLQPHDVYHEDWIRLTQDLALAWSGHLPMPRPNDRPIRRSTMAVELIDLWNSKFFAVRGVEVVLYKGRQRRSGPLAGIEDIHFHSLSEDDLSSSSSSSSDSEVDSEDDNRTYGYGAYGYGRQDQLTEAREARRRRRERKQEKKRRAKEKKLKRREKKNAKTYALYLRCLPRGQGAAAGGPAAAAGYGAAAGAAPGPYSAPTRPPYTSTPSANSYPTAPGPYGGSSNPYPGGAGGGGYTAGSAGYPSGPYSSGAGGYPGSAYSAGGQHMPGGY